MKNIFSQTTNHINYGSVATGKDDLQAGSNALEKNQRKRALENNLFQNALENNLFQNALENNRRKKAFSHVWRKLY